MMTRTVDTSVLVALWVNEPRSEDELVSSLWNVTEFASALGIQQRTGQITKRQAQLAWQNSQ